MAKSAKEKMRDKIIFAASMAIGGILLLYGVTTPNTVIAAIGIFVIVLTIYIGQ